MIFNIFNKTRELEWRLEALERSIIALKYPEGFEIGSEVYAGGFGYEKKKCFIASEIRMKNGVPHIDVFIPDLRPPLRTIGVEYLITK